MIWGVEIAENGEEKIEQRTKNKEKRELRFLIRDFQIKSHF